MEMDIETLTTEESTESKQRSRLNSIVAITVVLLVTFMGLCKVKDDNIVQAMQQAQADKIDNWSWYQARNIREDLYRSTAAQFEAQAKAATPSAKSTFAALASRYKKDADSQVIKKAKVQTDALNADKTYNAWNIRDDEFDLSDAALAIAMAMLGMTSLTQKRWLYVAAMIPGAFGVLMGLSGFFGWGLHPDVLAKFLGT